MNFLQKKKKINSIENLKNILIKNNYRECITNPFANIECIDKSAISIINPLNLKTQKLRSNLYESHLEYLSRKIKKFKLQKIFEHDRLVVREHKKFIDKNVFCFSSMQRLKNIFSIEITKFLHDIKNLSGVIEIQYENTANSLTI